MTAQEQGLRDLATACRVIIPPQLDFLVLVFRHEDPIAISYVTSTTLLDGDKRAREAAAIFAAQGTGATPAPRN